uniref:non-specific serine/threonine protein kinase n=1 Tax=Leersia perrieri TaxID=77586 RepID=A0A0D9WZT6_9ORYZ
MLAALLILLLTSPPSPAAGDRWFCGDGNAGTYTPNSTYMSNLDSLAGSLIAGATKLNSATGAAGAGSDRVYGAVLCRGDSTGADCGDRLRAAFAGIVNVNVTGAGACERHKDVALYNELYQLRFSDEDFLSSFSNSPEWVDVTNTNRVANAVLFEEVVGELLGALAEAAARRPERYAADEARWAAAAERERTVYGLVQCTRDMPPERCRGCLDGVIAERQRKIAGGEMGGAIHGVRCSLRYETDTQFFTTTGKFVRQKKGHAIVIIGAVYSLSIVCTRLFFCFLSIRRKQKRAKINSMEQTTDMDEVMKLWKMEDAGSEFSLYDFSQIADATNNFSANNILGKGGFGPVYKGLFPDGRELAIKKLAAQSSQGLVEFKNEIQLVAKLQHKNLVRLFGCCIHEEQKILIYEYLPNKSLDHFIFGTFSSLAIGNQTAVVILRSTNPTRRALLNWKTRRKIVEGIAQGLLYLHKHSRLRIIHRDLKASNILLDAELDPKISDFGMARIFPLDASQAKASRLVGTYGYMAPEYASEGLLSVKSDVFSFGVLLLEIMSGRRSAGFQQHGEFQNLLEYAWGMWKDGRWRDFIDQSFNDEYKPGEMMKCLVVALMCVQEKSVERPTMSDVVAMLSSDDIPLSEPKQPAYSHIRVDVSEDVNVSYSKNEMTITINDGR